MGLAIRTAEYPHLRRANQTDIPALVVIEPTGPNPQLAGTALEPPEHWFPRHTTATSLSPQ